MEQMPKKSGQKLFCAECEVIVTEMRHGMFYARNSSETVLVEKRKKKIVVPYGETRVAVVDMLDKTCKDNDGLRVWRFDRQKGRYYRLPWKGWGQHIGDNMFTIIQACDELVSEHEETLTDIFYENEADALDLVCKELLGVCADDWEFDDQFQYYEEDLQLKEKRKQERLEAKKAEEERAKAEKAAKDKEL
eukprot:CAMPEP_0114559660 /NCGR_PEP_ID=MMETSP0114-20121206/11038_1 /TAXON_ID=31324 /ORGANISM="Goniomonas sp, Strain m" /LENGTH=190 /DNA_ID=CAMNT_0001745141 /DNA_START=112 /DNA_END=684 /DNA_ORIENTATION=+